MQNSIKAVREERGISRSDLAARMQVDFSTVWRWEEGQVEVPWGVLRKIAALLQVAPIALVPEFNVIPDDRDDTPASPTPEEAPRRP
jgi:transcriptional regulator with XRE-family HTH domain